ncbi:DUF2336 domain-containing protein [Deinococcus indicus]|uniref:DUF2336 domain-containing protein n=1 Tax=Deinococcus indicus TaxID=223556 RepID=UPI00117757FC|nr:DUF2336 domain-containing protein [Deinococcus indicus]GHG14233.1 hypothetical protein GCM10017784_00260 [Deinococcus indicus]
MTLDWKALKREARKLGTSAERLAELARISPDLAREVARAQNTPPQVLEVLARTSDSRAVLAVMSNPNTPPALLMELASSQDTELLLAIAGNRSTPPEVLRKLSERCHRRMADRLAANPATTLDVLEAIAERVTCLTTMGLEILVGYGDNAPCPNLDKTASELIKGMALTELIPGGAARRLLSHPSPEVRQTLSRHIEKVARSVRTEIQYHLTQLGAHP